MDWCVRGRLWLAAIATHSKMFLLYSVTNYQMSETQNELELLKYLICVARLSSLPSSLCA